MKPTNPDGRETWQLMLELHPQLTARDLTSYWAINAHIETLAERYGVEYTVVRAVLGNYDPETDTLD